MEATEQQAAYCLDVLAAKLLPGRKLTGSISELIGTESCPLFVTLKKERSGALELRGCIGTFSPVPLHEGLRDYALSSAFNDRRFAPVEAKELPRLHCGISLLTDFEDMDSVWEWEVGRHGIWIWFYDEEGEKRNATYLPEVAEQQNWSKEEALRSLVGKALGGKYTKKELPSSMSLTRYQSSKAGLSFTDYEKKVASGQLTSFLGP